MTYFTFKVWETKHEEKYLGDIPFDDLDILIRQRPVSDAEKDEFFARLKKAPIDGYAETLYVRADWTIDAVKSGRDSQGALLFQFDNFMYDCEENGSSGFRGWCQDNIEPEDEEMLDKVESHADAIAWLLCEKGRD